MIIKCPECKHPVSDRAPVCPYCGCPICSPVSVDNKETQTIEQTGKKYKGGMLMSVGLFILFMVLFFEYGNENYFYLGFASLLLTFVFKIGAWWEHG